MTFDEIFKSSFLENMASFSAVDAALALISSLIMGGIIYLMYKRFYQGILYSEAFNLSLVLLTVLTTFVILAVTSNVVLSLGMVGALSIVRFRTAIKDPLDLVFLFWAIGEGIVLGAGLIPLAAMSALIIGIILMVRSGYHPSETPYLCLVRIEQESSEVKVHDILAKRTRKQRLKSKSIQTHGIELILELQLQDQDNAFVNEIAAVKGVTSVQLISTSGEANG